MAYGINEEKCAEHLSRAVQYPTLPHEVEEGADFSIFYEFQNYLKETYPLVHSTMEVETVGKAGLLYHWKGTGRSDNKPLLLMAHQDVVPAGDESKWTYPPFSGTIADGNVWGRGSSDCKAKLIAQMEACEYLISTGFVPDYDLYLSYSYNEEIGTDSKGESGAILAARLLESRGIRLGAVMDEGGGVRSGKSVGCEEPVCCISLGEKGYADYEISRSDRGGHSARPRKEGAFWYIAKAILAIEDNPYPYRLIPAVKTRFEALAPYISKADPEYGALLTDMEGNWDKWIPYFDADPQLAAMFHTTMAVTMAHGSDEANILPEKASIVVNCRLLEGDTLESVKAYLESIIPEGMEVKLLKGNEASPVSPYETPLKDLINDVCREHYGDFVMIPDITVGGTDARRMYGVCDCVYRFSPFAGLGGNSNAHAANEYTPVHSLFDAAECYADIIERYGDYQ